MNSCPVSASAPPKQDPDSNEENNEHNTDFDIECSADFNEEYTDCDIDVDTGCSIDPMRKTSNAIQGSIQSARSILVRKTTTSI
mmetsp:Transcript_15537/g.43058  ORF Transcript_15537/g.43058 Transcript_15537/m.43058 type:complete len:84 (+) Transcript_15537:90-341(+)